MLHFSGDIIFASFSIVKMSNRSVIPRQKATIGLKKSQLASIQAIEEEASDEQYKFARLKRKAVRVQYPGGTVRVGELQANYRSLCNRAMQAKRDCGNRLQHHVQLINDISSAEEWIRKRQE
jgi:hypothetical protein